LIERNVEQLYQAEDTPFFYTDLGKELGHTGDSHIVQDIFEGKFEHADLSDNAIHALVEQLHKHPSVDKILKHVVTPEEFKSAFKCIPDKTASSFSERGVHHYKV
jgi:hypothetical protein